MGTRLTRITRDLALRDPDAALASASEAVADWSGGTRIGGYLSRTSAGVYLVSCTALADATSTLVVFDYQQPHFSYPHLKPTTRTIATQT